MTNYTSLELSKRIYEAFGWGDALAWWQWSLPDGEPYIAYPELERRWGLFSTQDAKSGVPTYNSDYLLNVLQNKLPAGEYVGVSADNDKKGNWFASTSTDHAIGYVLVADTPSEALGLLCLKLREEGLL